jgi:hypothetical protein
MCKIMKMFRLLAAFVLPVAIASGATIGEESALGDTFTRSVVTSQLIRDVPPNADDVSRVKAKIIEGLIPQGPTAAADTEVTALIPCVLPSFCQRTRMTRRNRPSVRCHCAPSNTWHVRLAFVNQCSANPVYIHSPDVVHNHKRSSAALHLTAICHVPILLGCYDVELRLRNTILPLLNTQLDCTQATHEKRDMAGHQI